MFLLLKVDHWIRVSLRWLGRLLTFFIIFNLCFIVKMRFSSVTQSCPTLCSPVGCSTPGFSVHHQLLELAQTQVHYVGDAFQPSHPLLSPSPPAFSLSQHQGPFQWVSSSHKVAKVLELQHSLTLLPGVNDETGQAQPCWESLLSMWGFMSVGPEVPAWTRNLAKADTAFNHHSNPPC